jgi:ATPase subunit of ABC transporter with duplicated ATPase domains
LRPSRRRRNEPSPLSEALEGYRGALLVASHDVPFLRSAGITRWLRLDREAGLTVIDPP